jgi:hypothetical protein
MKYPPAPLTPFLASPLCIRRRMHILTEQRELKDHRPTLSASIACRLLVTLSLEGQSLASLFPSPFLYFQAFAASFRKTPGVWGTVFLGDTSAFSASLYPEPRRERYPLPSFVARLSTFRINTCKSVSKQMTLTPFRMNTYAKTGGGVGYC